MAYDLLLGNYPRKINSMLEKFRSSSDKFAPMRAIKRLGNDCFFVPRKLLSKNLPWPLPFAAGAGQVAICQSSFPFKGLQFVSSSQILQNVIFLHSISCGNHARDTSGKIVRNISSPISKKSLMRMMKQQDMRFWAWKVGGWERKECLVVHQKFMEGLKLPRWSGGAADERMVRGEKELA